MLPLRASPAPYTPPSAGPIRISAPRGVVKSLVGADRTTGHNRLLGPPDAGIDARRTPHWSHALDVVSSVLASVAGVLIFRAVPHASLIGILCRLVQLKTFCLRPGYDPSNLSIRCSSLPCSSVKRTCPKQPRWPARPCTDPSRSSARQLVRTHRENTHHKRDRHWSCLRLGIQVSIHIYHTLTHASHPSRSRRRAHLVEVRSRLGVRAA